jgi:hypothetical protein
MVAALLGGGAWYFGLFSGGVSGSAAEATQAASPSPETAVPVVEALPVEPPALLPEMAPVVEATFAAPEATSAPENPAGTASAPKTQSQAAPSAPGVAQVQEKAPVRVAPSTKAVQPQNAPASMNVPKAESSKPPSPNAESRLSAEPNDPFAECRKIAKYFERVFCEEKARFRLCQGKWGTTPECPSNSFGE